MEVKPLRQSSVPAGYKRTEVGVIPEEWEVASLAELCAFITKGSTPTTYGFKWEQSGVLFLRSECVSDDGLDLGKSMFISKAAHSLLRRSEVCDGDVLITITGNVGRVVRLSGVGVANLNQHIARVRVTAPNADGQYVFHILSQPCVRKRFGSITTGQAYPQISLQQVRDAKIPLPPLQEQRAIAGALSDVDALIGALDQLIAKKRDLKQATIQQLLTGKKRLAGFEVKPGYKQTDVGVIPVEWDVSRLSSLTALPIQNGVFNEPARKGRGCKLINVIDLYSAVPIDTANLERFDATRDEIARFRVAHGDLFFTRSSLTPDGIAHCNIYGRTQNEDIVFDCHIIRVRVNASKVEPFFLASYCTSRPARSYLIATAKTTTMTTIDQGVIANLPVPVPPLREQTAIAEVLSDMDAELAALEQRRDKTRALKQGMMQELLTGRTRLPVDEGTLCVA